MDVRALFDELASLGPEERLRRLDQLDAGESQRRSVLSLLARGGTCWLDRPLIEQTWFAREAFAPTDAPDPDPADAAEAAGAPNGAPRLGPFRLIGLLGRGGSSVVWLAEADEPPRRVALKQLLGPRLRDLNHWIAHECEAQAHVNDPGIARLLDSRIEPDGSAWIAMDYVDGLPITEWCERHALDSRARVALVVELASVIVSAHAAGVVHRDLKPANVLVDRERRVRVLDFGLARVSGAEADVAAGRIVGTLAYMAPEQAAADTEPDARVDVCGLGAVLHELLAGRPPHSLDGLSLPEALERIRSEEPARLDPTFGDLGEVVAKALARDRTDRYASAAELRDDLRRWLEHRPVRARRADIGRAARLALRRHPLVARTVLIALLVLAVGTGLALTALAAAADEARDEQSARASWALLADGLRLDELEAAAASLWPADPQRLPALREALTRLDTLLAPEPGHDTEPAPPPDSAESWRREQQDLLGRRLAAARNPATGLRASLVARIERATDVGPMTIDAHSEEWAAARAAVALDARFPGFDLVPQLGLVPLGPDPSSGLQEFAAWGCGAIVERDASDGLLRLADDSAPVLVLVPGGRFRLGCQLRDQTAARFDPDAQWQDEANIEVDLDPFFIGKHELSRRQWQSMAGSALRDVAATTLRVTTLAGDRHPATHLSWELGTTMLARHGFQLPTEAQWERAARGGSDTPWWFGSDPALAAMAGNVCDGSRHGDCGGHWIESTLDDGFESIAPIDTGLPNGFGLYGLVGNAAEMCRDVYLTTYRGRLRSGDGLHEPGPEELDASRRSLRGGSALDPVSSARCAARSDIGVDQAFLFAGVRLVRPVTGEVGHER